MHQNTNSNGEKLLGMTCDIIRACVCPSYRLCGVDQKKGPVMFYFRYQLMCNPLSLKIYLTHEYLLPDLSPSHVHCLCAGVSCYARLRWNLNKWVKQSRVATSLCNLCLLFILPTWAQSGFYIFWFSSCILHSLCQWTMPSGVVVSLLFSDVYSWSCLQTNTTRDVNE